MGLLISRISRELSQFGWVPGEFRKHAKFIKKLSRDGLSLEYVVDVGAYRGAWSRAIKNVLPKSQFFLVDTNNQHANQLRLIGVFLEALLSDREQVHNLYKVGGTGDSYYRELTSEYENIQPIPVTSRRADSIEELPKVIDLLKIDTQGSELDVLRGFGTRLANTKLVILEVPLYEYNSGAPNFSEYIIAMSDLGFYAAKVLDTHYVDGALYALDLAFVKNPIP